MFVQIHVEDFRFHTAMLGLQFYREQHIILFGSRALDVALERIIADTVHHAFTRPEHVPVHFKYGPVAPERIVNGKRVDTSPAVAASGVSSA